MSCGLFVAKGMNTSCDLYVADYVSTQVVVCSLLRA
jgi:hypothetical protein